MNDTTGNTANDPTNGADGADRADRADRTDRRTSGGGDVRESPWSMALPALVALVIVLGSSLLMAGDLPARVPSRWGPDGEVGTAPLWLVTAVTAALIVFLTVLFVALRRRIAPGGAQRTMGALAAGTPVALATLHVGTLIAATADEPSFPAAAGILALVAAAVGGAVGAVLVRPVEQEPVLIDAAVIPVAPGEAVVWTGPATAPAWLIALLVGAGLLGGGVAFASLPWVGLLVLVVVGLSLGLLVVR